MDFNEWGLKMCKNELFILCLSLVDRFSKNRGEEEEEENEQH